MKEICFTDHLCRYYLPTPLKKRYWDWGMQIGSMKDYCEELQMMHDIFEGRCAVKTGLEIDFIEGAEDLLQDILRPLDFDFILGSIHCIPTIGWRHLSHYSVFTDQEIIIREYFRLCHNCIRSGLFNSLAHIDSIWRYLPRAWNFESLFREEIGSLVRTAAEHSVALELNSNAFLWSLYHKLDELDFLDLLFELIRTHNCGITIGSDSHKPAQVGNAFQNIACKCREYGIKNFNTYSRRKCIFNSLHDHFPASEE